MFRFSLFISTVLLSCCLNDCIGQDTLSSFVLCNPVTTNQPNISLIARGPPGIKGSRGEKGEIGLKGETGELGLKGERGESGSRGLPGNKGESDASNQYRLAALTRRVDQLTSTLSSLQNVGLTRIGGRWYRTSPAKLSWPESRVYCLALGGDLATVGMRDAGTRRLMFNQNFLTRGENYWIGMNDIVNEGTLVWIDGVAQNSSNSNFAPGEPNDIGYIGANADCVRLFSSAVALLMDDIECSRNVFALCEKN